MTPSVTEYHFFFLAHEADEIEAATDETKQQAALILRTLLQYLEKGRLQVLTLCLPAQFPAGKAALAYHELGAGTVPDTPRPWLQSFGLPGQLLDSTMPGWRLKRSWSELQGCTLQAGTNESTRLFIKAAEQTSGAGELLIHGALSELPGRSLVGSMMGRRLLSMASVLLPGEKTRTELTLLSGSRVHIELLDSPDGAMGLQPLLVIKATAD
ncbi:hypothetical protein [Allohahella marinimesophila]|uniref:Uncharacterized protein n=1 Tax=Allohahella marinimesophila TaxID=1054972 RepID=A0ABP7PUY7_9GAMM